MNNANFHKLLEYEQKIDKKRRRKELNKAVRCNNEVDFGTQKSGYKKTKKKFNSLS